MTPLRLALSLLGAASLGSLASAQISSSADYEVLFDATWSSSTHPSAYPAFAHFSPLIGATHDSSIQLWTDGGIATNGIESMAETGGTFALTGEINAAIGAGSAGSVVTGGVVGISPGTATANLTATTAHSKLSLVTMIAPSPDWFVGIDSVDLIENGRWVDQKTIDLYAWDAGTDSGPNFNSSNQNTVPQEPIHLLTNGPFFGTVPLGTFTITRKSGASYCSSKLNSQGCLPLISSTGSASMTPSQGFDIHANDVLNNKNGILFYGLADNSVPFQGGTLCVMPPLSRTPVQDSAGNPPPNDCSGSFTFDMNALIQGGSDPSLTIGTRVFAQYWSRDPQSPSQTSLSNGIDFLICP